MIGISISGALSDGLSGRLPDGVVYHPENGHLTVSRSLFSHSGPVALTVTLQDVSGNLHHTDVYLYDDAAHDRPLSGPEGTNLVQQAQQAGMQAISLQSQAILDELSQE